MSTENGPKVVQNNERKEADPMIAFEEATNILPRNIETMSRLIKSGAVKMDVEQWKKFDALRDKLFRLKTHAAATL